MNRLTAHSLRDQNVAVKGRWDRTALESARPEVHGSIYVPIIHRKTSCACGGGCPRCQAKSLNLPISQPNDASEIEADRIADKVMRMPTNSVGNEKVQLKPIQIPQAQFKYAARKKNEEGQLQRKETKADSGQTAPPIVNDVIGSSGRLLDSGTRQFMESLMGFDFSHVQVHTDSKAAESASSINALAYTSGNHIVYNSGQYAADTERGKWLLAHELTHVGQQSNNSMKNCIQRFSDTDHHVLEEVALSSVFSEEELKSIEQGNMQRDYSQVPPILNLLLLGSNQNFGGYKTHEHFDNFIFDQEKNRWVSHDEYEKIWDDNTRQWVKRTVPLVNTPTTPKKTPLQYIEGELLTAVEKNMPDSGSFIHLGNAFHTIEDFFAHSNFVELTKGDFSAGKELTTHASGVPGPSSEVSILSNISDPGSASFFADKFSSEYEKASPLSHGRLAKDFHINPNHSMAITLAALVVKQVGLMLKSAFTLNTKEQRREYVQYTIMTTLSNYFRPPTAENKWWEKLIADDMGQTGKKIKELQDKTPVTVNQSPSGLFRSLEATKFSSWKAFGLGTSYSIPLKDKTFFTAGYMLYLPGSGATLDDKILVAPRSDWDQSNKPKIIFGAQISGTFDVTDLLLKTR